MNILYGFVAALVSALLTVYLYQAIYHGRIIVYQSIALISTLVGFAKIWPDWITAVAAGLLVGSFIVDKAVLVRLTKQLYNKN
ncbi:hypothetical protein ACFL1A_01765 [Patescibacteria group bacterium]